MSNLQPVRGTHDLLADDCRLHRHVETVARDTSELYGFDEVATPIFEFTDVFARTLGDTSDIVTKEMYTFETKGGESITLRPEGTAGIARAFISNGLAQHVPLKLFYHGPMFRHERPQKGRQRQFHQVGVESIGSGSPQADVEVIALGYKILNQLGLAKEVNLEINSLGDSESRANYRNVLLEYFTKHESSLSADSKARLQKNPLRILDSKDEQDRRILSDTPALSDYLNRDSSVFIESVERGLNDLKLPFEKNPNLVRGLDYYCHTAFEFTTTSLGAQGTVLAGGRYDGLIERMGGPATPGVGWAAGVERLAMLTTNTQNMIRPFAVVPVSNDLKDIAMLVVQTLRDAAIPSDLAFSGNIKRRLKRADKLNARAAVILGEEELKDGNVVLRDLDSGDQTTIALANVAEAIKDNY